MKNTTNSAPPFLVAEQEITLLEVLMIDVDIEVGSGNFNLAPPPMIAMEDDDDDDDDDDDESGVFYYEPRIKRRRLK